MLVSNTMTLENQIESQALPLVDGNQCKEHENVHEDVIQPNDSKEMASETATESFFGSSTETGTKQPSSLLQLMHSEHGETDAIGGNADHVGSVPDLPLEQTQSPLFQLPYEVRRQIYEHVFTLSPDARILPPHVDKSQADVKSVLEFLRTCRRVLHEAETLFYSTNHLRVDVFAIPAFLGTRRREAIKAVEVLIVRYESVFAHVEALQTLPNLQSLHIVSRYKSIRFWDLDAWYDLLRRIELGLTKMKALREVKVSLEKGEVTEVIEVGDLLARATEMIDRIPFFRYN